MFIKFIIIVAILISLAGAQNSKTVLQESELDRLMEFILSDQTDKSPRVEGVYECIQSTQSFHNNGTRAGFELFPIHLSLPDEDHVMEGAYIQLEVDGLQAVALVGIDTQFDFTYIIDYRVGVPGAVKHMTTNYIGVDGIGSFWEIYGNDTIVMVMEPSVVSLSKDNNTEFHYPDDAWRDIVVSEIALWPDYWHEGAPL